jgi:uncharacterized protein involved in tolerance to divalent cations
MKVKILSMIVIFALLSTVSQAQSNNFKRYPFKSAIVEYSIEGSAKGSKTIYIDDYGYYEATYENTSTKIMGTRSTENKATIIIGDKVHSVDFEKNNVFTTTNPSLTMYSESNMDEKKLIDRAEKSLVNMGFSKTGTEVFLNRKCDIWEGMSKMYLWKGLTLKSETSIMGMKTIEIAQSVKTNVKIPSSKFEVPGNIETDESQAEYNQYMKNATDLEMDDKSSQEMAKYKNMKYPEYRKMMKKQDPNMDEETIKQSYEQMQMVFKMFK